jgi:hypothetical protein
VDRGQPLLQSVHFLHQRGTGLRSHCVHCCPFSLSPR